MIKDRLEREMRRKGVSVKQLCGFVHISRSTYYRKCKGVSEFTQGEMQRIMELLGLKSPMDIFFTKEVS